MTLEAKRTDPLETGGVLLGYWADTGEVVVASVVGPGPAAVHRRDRFLPDHAYQEREVALAYRESGRRITYLGDWHSHPSGLGTLSRRDRVTLRRIGNNPGARAPRPLMAIVTSRVKWDLSVWHGELRKFAWWPGSSLRLTTLQVIVYESDE